MSSTLANPWALYGLLLLLPVVLLYLLRPKPKDLRVPSLMFIREIEEKKRFSSLFRRIIKDPLLLLQLLMLIFLVLVLANPTYTTKEFVMVEEDIAIVLDVSASMNAGEVSRLSRAKEEALEIVDDLDKRDRVSVILSENVPAVALKGGSHLQARAVIEELGPKDTTTGLGAAILLASDLIEDSKVKKKIYVVSDFGDYDGMDPRAAQKTATAKNIDVEFIKISEEVENYAIIAAKAEREGSLCVGEGVVKNYGPGDATIGLGFYLDGKSVSAMDKQVAAGSSEPFILSSECGGEEYEAILKIENGDGLQSDDYAYFVIEEEFETDVLLIKEEDSDEYVDYALSSLEGLDLERSDPPVYPPDYEDYDVVVFQEAKEQNILGGTFPEIRRFVRGGGRLIMMASPALANLEAEAFDGLLPIEGMEMSYIESRLHLNFDHRILKDVDIDGLVLKKFVGAEEKMGSVTLVSASGSPVISHWSIGEGIVLYLGISSNSTWSDFALDPGFPIFWHNTFEWFRGNDNTQRLRNFKTGERMGGKKNETVELTDPRGKTIRGNGIILDKAGYYSLSDGTKIAASLLDEGESDVNIILDTESVKTSKAYVSESVEEDVPHELFWPLACVVLLLLLFEWHYYIGRGQL